MWQTLQQLTQSCYFFATTLFKVHLKQTLFFNTERITILFSASISYTSLLYFLSYATEIRLLRTGGFCVAL